MTETITKNTLLSDVILNNDMASEILFEAGLGCVGCHFSEMETIEEGAMVHGMTEEDVNDIEVNDPVAVVPVNEQNADGVTRYSLDCSELEEETPKQEFVTPAPEVTSELIEEEFTISSAAVEKEEVIEAVAPAVEIDPFNTSIEDSLKLRADARRRKLKEFNYKFRHNNNVDEIEKEPAYKRMGID